MAPLLKYALLQIPGIVFVGALLFALWRWEVTSGRTAGSLLALWVAKDVAFYPLLRRAYEPSGAHGAARLVGRTGVARRRLAPRGYVAVGGELWLAELRDRGAALAEGMPVRVVGGRRLTLIVVPDDPAGTEARATAGASDLEFSVVGPPDAERACSAVDRARRPGGSG